MPQRIVTLVIVALWLATLAWMWQRDAAALRRAPPWTFDVGDEATSHNHSWLAFVDQQEVAHMVAALHGDSHGLFDLHGSLTFKQPVKLHGLFPHVVSGKCQFTPRGVVRKIEGHATCAEFFHADTLREKDRPRFVELTGEIEAGSLTYHLTPPMRQQPSLLSVSTGDHGQVLLPLLPLPKLKHLREGQRWRVPVVDILEMATVPNAAEQPLPILDAEVKSDSLLWNEEPTDCWRVEYREGEAVPRVITWVRRSDGTVLRQSAHYGEVEIVLERRQIK